MTTPRTAVKHPNTMRNWHEDHRANLNRGERAADIMRHGMGSGKFVGRFLGFMVVWAILNTAMRGWDPHPFILLNLFLSMLAGLQGAILLIAAKRQDAIARPCHSTTMRPISRRRMTSTLCWGSTTGNSR